MLALLNADLDEDERLEISGILDSYLLRRAVCNLGAKNYNRVFLTLTRNLRNEGFSAAGLKKHLLTQTGESNVWPDDATFRDAWLHKPLYGPLNSPKLIHLFGRPNQTFMSAKSERVVFTDAPTVEHIMPQTWIENWPLADGSQRIEFMALS